MPAAIPVTTPVLELTVATDVLPLLHVPPLVALLNVVVNPTQVLAMPVLAPGPVLTVTTVVLGHPDACV